MSFAQCSLSQLSQNFVQKGEIREAIVQAMTSQPGSYLSHDASLSQATYDVR